MCCDQEVSNQDLLEYEASLHEKESILNKRNKRGFYQHLFLNYVFSTLATRSVQITQQPKQLELSNPNYKGFVGLVFIFGWVGLIF